MKHLHSKIFEFYNKHSLLFLLGYRLFKRLYFFAIISFMLLWGVEHKEEIASVDFSNSFLTALLLNFLAISFLSLPFFYSLKDLRCKVYFKQIFWLHLDSWSLRYLPIKVGPQLMKLDFAYENGIDKKPFFCALFLEVFLLLLFTIPYFFIGFVWQEIALKYCLLYFCLFLLLLVFKSYFYDLIFRLILKEVDLSLLRLVNYLKQYLLYSVFYLLIVLSFLVITQLVVDASFERMLWLGALYLFSSFISTLAPFAPGGIGVREALLVYFMKEYYDLNDCMIIVSSFRLVNFLADVAILFLSRVRFFSSFKCYSGSVR